MNKYRFLSSFNSFKLHKYKEPKKINLNVNLNINTIEDVSIKIKKNTDINDIDYSKNFWENVEKYKSNYK